MKKTKSFKWLRTVGFLSLSLWILISFLSGSSFAAQEDFPKKEITIIVSMAAGGGRDTLCRGLARTMSKYLGVPMVVMNFPGAGGVIGYTKTYQSAPDGYTLGTIAMPDVFHQLVEKTDYDVRKSIYLGRALSSSGNWFVHPDSPFRSVKDLKTYGKSIRYSAFTYGSPETIVAMVVADREGWPLKIIGGYKGALPSALALVRGDVDLTGAYYGGVGELARAGKIRAILTMGPKRVPEVPDVPTVGEMGHPDLEIFTLDTCLHAPPGVPKDRIEILENAFMKTLQDPEFVQWAKGAKLGVAWLNGAETTKRIYGLFDVLGKYKGTIEKYMEKK